MNEGLLPYRSKTLFPKEGGWGELNEKLLQFIWQFQYFNNTALCTVSGEPVEVVFPGKINHHQGPDFTDARIRVGGTLLAGSVELHLKTSQWKEHLHHQDPNYANVILHVVLEHNESGMESLPVLELESRIPKLLLERYERLMQSSSFIPCSTSLSPVPTLVWTSWKERLVAERLTRKSEQVFRFLEESRYHWEECFWWLLARNFGMTVNTDAFEAVARSLNLNLLLRHKHQIHQLEALLFGQANLLNENFKEDYPLMLKREYHFLKKKYGLKPVFQPIHFLRMRPGNFPTVRLAQLASLLHTSYISFSDLIKMDQPDELVRSFAVTANDYWHYHYLFDGISSFRKKVLGQEAIRNILINSVVPLLFTYGLHQKDESYTNKALRFLESVSMEQNTITKGFLLLGVEAKSAFDSQSLIELKTQYCDPRKCLSCAIGTQLLKY